MVKDISMIDEIITILGQRIDNLKELESSGVLLPSELIHKSNEISSIQLLLGRYKYSEKEQITQAHEDDLNAKSEYIEYSNDTPPEEGYYLTINKYRYEDIYKTPIVLKFMFQRYRDTNELVLDENGKPIGCWLDLANNGVVVEYYCNLPPTPNKKRN